jgi:hypothetical protein
MSLTFNENIENWGVEWHDFGGYWNENESESENEMFQFARRTGSEWRQKNNELSWAKEMIRKR